MSDVTDLRRLVGKVAVVTGGSSGIGKATVDLFILHGATVVSIDLNPPGNLETPYPEGVEFIRGSARDTLVWDHAISTAKRQFGRAPNILVQCAGIPGREGLLDTTVESFDRVMSINATAIMMGMQAFVRELGGEPGSIVNVSSLAGVVSMTGGFAYEASKAACTHMTKTVSLEYAKSKIRANCVAPGLTFTGMTRNTTRSEWSRQYMLDRTPLSRWGTALETAYSILYLASDEAAYVTGQTICHDGGYSAA